MIKVVDAMDISTRVIPPQEHMTLEQCIGSWLMAKRKRTDSQRTESDYGYYLSDFRSYLWEAKGRDLDGIPAIIAPVAQLWADHNKKTGKQGVSPSTFRVRIATISSFYEYAIAQEVLTFNPMKRVEQPKRKIEHAAPALDFEKVKQLLKLIDRSTLSGKRDYALISVALETTRRVSELAGLRMGDIRRINEGYTEIHWRRCKGNKTRDDVIKARTSKVLFDYLESYYITTKGYTSLSAIPRDAPVWVSLSMNNAGGPLATKSLQRICSDVLGDSRFHTTRHTGAVTAFKKGVPLDQVSKLLGHERIDTTAIYLEDKLPYENKHGDQIEDAFGIGEE